MNQIGKLSLVATTFIAISQPVLAEVKTGYFIDAPVTGLYYKTDSEISGKTDKGAYQYNDGDIVTFYLGNNEDTKHVGTGTTSLSKTN